jgi:hypothetical protein
MLRRYVLAGAVMAAVSQFSPGVAAAAPWGPDFRAEEVMTSEKDPDKVQRATFYFSKGRMRREGEIPAQDETRQQFGGRWANITNPYKGAQWMVMPDARKYMERTFKAPSSVQPPPDPGDPSHPCQSGKGGMTCKDLGRASVHGRTTQKWEVVTQRGKQTMRQVIYWDPQLHYPIREEVPGMGGHEYRNIRIGTLPDHLFEVPQGYEKVEMPRRSER